MIKLTHRSGSNEPDFFIKRSSQISAPLRCLQILSRQGSRGALSLAGLLLLVLSSGCGQTHTKAEVDPPSVAASTGTCPDEFAYVPAGSYRAGSTEAERDYAYQISAQALANSPAQIKAAEARLRQQGWFENEPEASTRHTQAFCMGKNLITNADYQEFVVATGYHTPGITARNYQEQNMLVHPYSSLRPYLWQGSELPEGKQDHPVVLISYEDAITYAAWKSGKDGIDYRLPSADEWEKAARGSDKRYFTWGKEWKNDATNWQQHGPEGTSEAGAYPTSRSAYGVEDMAGNVFEFTSTLSNEGGQEQSIMKGCAWDDLPGFCRAAYRHSRPTSYRHILFGFRLVTPPE